MPSHSRPSPDGRRPRRASLSVLLCLLAFAADTTAQQPDGQQPDDQQPGARRGRRPQTVTALFAGTIHPISGPAIADGVVLVRGGQIVAVGSRADVEVPEDATVLEYPEGHVYPGLIDAMSQAFVDSDAGNGGGVDAGTDIDGALDPFHEPSRELVRFGITTAYVSNRGAGGWRGHGVLLSLSPTGPQPFRAGRETVDVGLHAKLAVSGGHPLQQIDQLAGAGKEFEQLEKYEEAFEKYDEQLEEFDKKYEEYLAWHRKRKPKDEDAKDGEKPPEAEEKPAGEGEEQAGSRGRRPGGGRRPRPEGEGPAEEGKPAAKPDGEKPDAPKPDGEKPDGKPDGKKEEGDKAPDKPKRPTEPDRDPSKDALIAVRDGELRMFFEVEKPIEIRRALEIIRERGLSDAVLENPRGAAAVADELALAGVRAVLTDALPAGEQSWLDDAAARQSPAVTLAASGVPFALGSGDLRRARLLPSIAAEAVGQGVDLDTAVRALTLTAAEVLGVEEQIGSLESGKRADLLVVSAPLLSSDSRVLRVLSAGRTVHDTATENQDR